MNSERRDRMQDDFLALDALILQEILRNLKQGTAEYNSVLAEVRDHQIQLAKVRCALGTLYSRIVKMRQPIRTWQKSLWSMGFGGGVSPDARDSASRAVGEYDRMLDKLVWDLFEFREDRCGSGT